jgi:aminoglycoside 6'-N-acetyltransferase
MTDIDLRGPRVRVRPLEAADRVAMAAILAEPDVAHWWVHEDLVTAVADLFDDEDEVRMAIEVEGEVGGMIQFSEETTPDYRHAGIDLFVGAAWQGRGIGPEAIRLVARHLFEERGHHRLIIDPAVDNERAVRAYEKVGFRRVGVLREYERHEGAWRDGLLMELLRDELTADEPVGR